VSNRSFGGGQRTRLSIYMYANTVDNKAKSKGMSNSRHGVLTPGKNAFVRTWQLKGEGGGRDCSKKVYYRELMIFEWKRTTVGPHMSSY